MDWADELAASVSGPQVVNDSKTPSGTVHVGSLRGPVILDTITRALRARGLETSLLYGVDDLDPMDAQALLTPDAVDHEMGRPLAHVPDQVDDGHASYARHHAQVFIDTFAVLGIRPDRYYWMSEIYPTGAMDPYIRLALDRADRVREIYRRVANVQHPDDWHPFQVICEVCGKVGTTIVTRWDGERVYYECRPAHVTWARGCGNSGWISPFGGTGKLGWNLEWAAQWSLFGVTIEPCGKDLSTAGGSRDRSDAVAREVFEREPPLNVAYEFMNIGGRKMSTSKGRGAAAHRIVEVVPPEQLRLLFLRLRPQTAIEFDPEGTDAIPRLFDEFDKLADATAGRPVRGTLPPSPERIFAYASLSTDPAVVAERAAAFRLQFSDVAWLVQQDGLDLHRVAAADKPGELSATEDELLVERERSARAWLEAYAPASARAPRVSEILPDAARDLEDGQRAFLLALATAAEGLPEDAAMPDWQNLIFRTAADSHTVATSRAAFIAIYLAFYGLSQGPRAGRILATQPRAFVIQRLREASSRNEVTA